MAMIIWRSVPYSGGQGLGREAAQVGAKTPIPSALEKPSNWAVVRQKPCQVRDLQNPLKRSELVAGTAKKEK